MRHDGEHTNRCVSGYFGSVGKWPHQLLIETKQGGMDARMARMVRSKRSLAKGDSARNVCGNEMRHINPFWQLKSNIWLGWYLDKYPNMRPSNIFIICYAIVGLLWMIVGWRRSERNLMPAGRLVDDATNIHHLTWPFSSLLILF